MEYIFRVETIHDLAVHKEFRQGYTYASRVQNLVRFLCIVFLIFCVTQFDRPLVVYWFLFLAFFHLMLHLLRNRKGGDLQYKQMLLTHNGQPQHLVICFCEDGIHSTDQLNGNNWDFRYDMIRSIIDTPRLIILIMPHRSCLVLQKDWIKGGSADELIAYLLKTCPDLKHRRPRKTTLGKWVYRAFALTLIVGSLFAIANLPSVSLLDKLPGKLHNDMTYQEISAELAEIGIQISDQAIKELEDYDGSYCVENGTPYYEDYPEASKAMDLLCWEGAGFYDEDTWDWNPSTSGVYWFDTEVWNIEAIYTDFFKGLSCMHEELDFTNITEDYSGADIEAGTGTVLVSFDLQGIHYQLEADYNYDWFDADILNEVCRLLSKDSRKNDLYYTFDGQAVLLYYGTGAQLRSLEWKTGIDFYDAIQLEFGF